MKVALLLLIIILIHSDNGVLSFTINFFKPGANYPHYKVGNKTDWVGVPASLNKVGIRMEYELGYAMAQRYITNITTDKLLSASYNPSEIMIISDDYNDSINSAYSFLLGLYGPDTFPPMGNVPDTSKLFPPVESGAIPILTTYLTALGNNVIPQSQTLIPVHVFDGNHDYILDPVNSCPFVFNLLDDHIENNGKRLTNIVKAKTTLVNLLSSSFGIKSNAINAAEIFKMYDYSNAAYYYAQDIGFNISTMDPSLFEDFKNVTTEVSYTYFVNGDDILNFTVSQLLSNVSAIINSTIATPGKKFFGYFVHDALLLPFLQVLSPLSGETLLSYASFLSMEVYVRADNTAYLMLSLNDAPAVQMELAAFNTIMSQRSFDKWNDYCFGPPLSKKAGYTAIGIEAFLLIVVIINWIVILKGRNRDKETLLDKSGE